MASMLTSVILLGCVIAVGGIVLDQQTYEMLFNEIKKCVAQRDQPVWLVPLKKLERPIDEIDQQSLDINILKPGAETPYPYPFGSGDMEKVSLIDCPFGKIKFDLFFV
jgi:hypothetical protein